VLLIRDVYPGSRVDKIPDLHKNWYQVLKIRSGIYIADPGFGFFFIPGSRIQGKKPNPGSGSTTLCQ
jgi:hypothetical protein